MKITDRIVSAQDLIDAGACYRDDEVRRLVPDPMPMSRLLDLDIPDDDKVWCVLSTITDKRERVGAAAVLVREVAHLSANHHVIECLDVCDRYARGEADEQELGDAGLVVELSGSADWGAVAASAVAESAWTTRAAAGSAGAATSAVWVAKSSDECAAESARAAAEQRQVELLRDMLTD
jgi:hypothetical protein